MLNEAERVRLIETASRRPRDGPPDRRRGYVATRVDDPDDEGRADEARRRGAIVILAPIQGDACEVERTSRRRRGRRTLPILVYNKPANTAAHRSRVAAMKRLWDGHAHAVKSTFPRVCDR